MARDQTSRHDRKTGIHAVARAAGVSTSTVSRALRDDRRIGEQTRERVKAAARDLGYVPDREMAEVLTRAAHRRDRDRPHALAIVGNRETDEGRYRSDEIHAGAADFAADFGYALTVYDSGQPGATFADHAGVLLCDNLWEDDRCAWVLDHPGVAIAIEPNSLRCRLDAVAGNHWAAMLRLLDETVARGYRRPGVAMRWGTDRSSCHQWLAAFRHWCQESDLVAPPPYSGPTTAAGTPRFREWLDAHGIDVVISRKSIRSLVAATGAAIGFANLGIRAPSARTTGLLQNYRRLGHEAIRLLDSRLRIRQVGLPEHPLLELVAHEWHEGDSLRPRADHRS